MKNYAIFDKEFDTQEAIGFLFYYEKTNSFIIELSDKLTEWEAPLLFQELVRRERYTIPKDIAMLWVRERIIPSGRQNIGAILKNEKMKDYDEMAMLRASKGRSSQDSCYIKGVSAEAIPDEIKKRSLKNISECFVTTGGQLICMLRDESVWIVDPAKLSDANEKMKYVIGNDALLRSVKVGAGGYSIVFGGTIEVDANIIRERGTTLPISAEDFFSFVRTNLVDTTMACEMMQCSRQNVSYLVKTNKLEPIFHGTKENLYTKGAIEAAL